jgi:hypothetical protein
MIVHYLGFDTTCCSLLHHKASYLVLHSTMFCNERLYFMMAGNSVPFERTVFLSVTILLWMDYIAYEQEIH